MTILIASKRDNFGWSLPSSIDEKLIVYVGRPSVLGNPFEMKGESDRDYVCDEYEEWFLFKRATGDNAVCDELERLRGLYEEHGHLILTCWCAPKRCHAETIRNWLLANC